MMEINLISKHRNALMAVAMFWLAFNHCYFPCNNKLFNFVVSTCGFGGVSLFVFLSAFGLYYSYKKDSNYSHFIKKRLKRILPFCFPVGFLHALIHKEAWYYGLIDGLGLSLFFRSDLTCWFNSFILVFYLLTPIYLKLLNRNPKKVTIVSSIVVTFICLLTNQIWQVGYVLFHFVIGFIGIYFAYLNDKKVTVNWLYVLISFIFGWIFMYFMYHYCGNEFGIKHIYPMLFIAPSMLLICAFILDKLKYLDSLLTSLGNYTYQFYLFHELIVLLMHQNYGLIYIPNIGFDTWFFFIALFGALIVAIIYKKLIDLIVNKKGNFSL